MNPRELFGTWPAPDPVFLKALDLWKAYYRDCDAFDGTTGPVPVRTRQASVAFARERLKLLAREAMLAEVPDAVLKDARDRALDEYERGLGGRGRERDWPTR